MPGFHSQVIILPYDDIGIITFSIGDHGGASLGNTIIAYNLVDRLLGLKQTDWNGRLLADHLKRKEMGKKARAQVGFDNVKETSPTHNINDYLGTYVNEVYGEFIIGKENDSLYFNFRRTTLPLLHYHYNRFDTPNDEILGKWSINFSVSPQGEISTAVISIDEGQVTFNKKTDESLSNPEILSLYTGTYEYAGSEFELKIKDNKLTMLGTTDEVLIPYKKHIFKVEKFDDMQIEFTEKNNKISGMKYKAPSGIFECIKIK
ncbi:beta-lactamase [Algibacter lectus]|uniref:Beta-lactamase n=1 Tax=Algibacter lectus TaxID=221126 RepID=A0A090X1B8_9FLAO|nr:DUF3471 domain-containing protein [Algibacter lectus]GAL82523.1 beta-lactamase [Algibacter lectus]